MNKIPDENKPILAKIQEVNSLGISYWFEVIYFLDNVWHRWGSKEYFTNGEQVVDWEYCNQIL